MTTIQTLEQTKIDELLAVFNVSFSDYIIPFHLTREQLENKIKSDRINLDLSVGAFVNNKLVGFILHGLDIRDNQKIIYNAGTGVVPSQRGKKLTIHLYDFILPKLQNFKIDTIVLEVITENKTAIKTYQNLGFVVARKLNCFKGTLYHKAIKNEYTIKRNETYDWAKIQSFWDFEPSWQNDIQAMEKLKETNALIEIYDAEVLLGYALFNPNTNKIQQFAVHKSFRNKGVGTSLFNEIGKNSSAEIAVINCDDSSITSTKFLEEQGLKNYISQYEMKLVLKEKRQKPI